MVAQPLIDNRKPNRRIELHAVHPPPLVSTDKGLSVAHFCAAATGPPGRSAWVIIPPPLTLHAFVAGTSAPGARVITDGWSGYGGLSDHDHAPKIVGTTPAHLVLRWSHRVFSNLKRWALGTFHGLRRPHLRRYLDEFVFRWNRRRHTATAFDALLGIATRLQPAGYRDIVEQRA